MSTDYLHNIYCPQLRTWLAGVSGGQEAIVDEFVSQLEPGEWLGVQLSTQQLASDCRLLTPFVPLSGARHSMSPSGETVGCLN